jgi:hypothetical protein
MPTGATAAPARLMADAVTTIELAGDESISLDFSRTLLEDLAARCDEPDCRGSSGRRPSHP